MPTDITAAIAALGGPEKALAIIATDFAFTSESEDSCIRTLALSALDAHDPAQGGKALLEAIALVVRDVAELPDRDSPDDWPEAMLVTQPELRGILESRLLASQPEPAAAPAPDARDAEARIAECLASINRLLDSKGCPECDSRAGSPREAEEASLDKMVALMREFAARPKAVTRRTVTQTGEHFCETQCKERVARDAEIADLRQKLAEAAGSLDTLRNFLSIEGVGEPHTHPAKLPVGRVIQLVKDLRQKLAAAEKEAERLTGLLDDVSNTAATLRDERDEAVHQQSLAWQRHAEKDRAYGDALCERDKARAQQNAVAVRELEAVRALIDSGASSADTWNHLDASIAALRTPQPTPAAEEPAAAAPDADSEEVVEQGPSTPTSPERPQGRQLLAQFLDWMNAEFPIDPNYDRFAAIRAGARELLSRISAAKEAT